MVEDPDSLWEKDYPKGLKDELMAKNLIIYDMYDRDARFWIDEPRLKETQSSGLGGA